MATYLIGHVKGAKGDKGDTGSAAGFGTPTASVDANVGTPSVTVTATGPDTAKVFDFEFQNMKGAKGDKGDKGDTGNTGAAAGFGTPTASVDSNTGTPSVSITASGSDTSKVFDFEFHNLKGETGATGPTGPTGPADTTALNIVRSTSTDAYKTTKSYKVGDYVIYNNTLYKCTSACSAGSWATNSSHFQATTVTSAITDLNASLTNLETQVEKNTPYFTSGGYSSVTKLKVRENGISHIVGTVESMFNPSALTVGSYQTVFFIHAKSDGFIGGAAIVFYGNTVKPAILKVKNNLLDVQLFISDDIKAINGNVTLNFDITYEDSDG